MSSFIELVPLSLDSSSVTIALYLYQTIQMSSKMDRFYLENATLYKTLVKGLNAKSASQTTKVSSGTCNPDMVVSARIRPLSEEDVSAGFPNAIFPLSGQAGEVDIHDLYNHPRGRPVLKVRTKNI